MFPSLFAAESRTALGEEDDSSLDKKQEPKLKPAVLRVSSKPARAL